jgi:hypothetical protein
MKWDLSTVGVESLGDTYMTNEQIKDGEGFREYLREEARIRHGQLTPFQINKGYWGLMPPVAWLKNIVQQCDAAGTKVFIKNNLKNWIMESAKTLDESKLFFNHKKINDLIAFTELRQECGARETFKFVGRIKVPPLPSINIMSS